MTMSRLGITPRERMFSLAGERHLLGVPELGWMTEVGVSSTDVEAPHEEERAGGQDAWDIGWRPVTFLSFRERSLTKHPQKSLTTGTYRARRRRLHTTPRRPTLSIIESELRGAATNFVKRVKRR